MYLSIFKFKNRILSSYMSLSCACICILIFLGGCIISEVAAATIYCYLPNFIIWLSMLTRLVGVFLSVSSHLIVPSA